jgi:EAL domain-containing protein (putative c-di-GMP-specific phosphodiesterase class I)
MRMSKGKPAEETVLIQSGTHRRRVQWMLWMGGSLMVLLGLVWGIFFGFRGDWAIVAMDGALVLCGVLALVLTQRAQTRSASLLMLGSLFLVICTMAAVLDVPSVQVPRSTHHYLLALVVCSFVLLRGESRWLYHGIPLLCFTAFLVFSSTQAGILTPYALPDSVRTTGSWITNAFALLALYASLHIMQNDFSAPIAMETELRQALAGNQFLLYYQPQVDAGGRMMGAEALLRWQHPARGLVLPNEFILLAEQTGLILPLGQWALQTACEQLVSWSTRPDTADLTLAVNVSARQLRQPDFVAMVLSIVAQTGANPTRLKLEITESLLVNDVEDTIAKMAALKTHGVGFSLDDFGTGYSSLSYLKRLPLDQLKIDRSFVHDVLTGTNDAAIVDTVIALGQSLGLTVIAEGVETEGQREFLARHGCQAFQGYLFSRALPAAEFDALDMRKVNAMVLRVVRNSRY